tara:strand:- start:15825 stop:15974 length:150 start_codon:yes stop_codon:yes gene_type:complete
MDLQTFDWSSRAANPMMLKLEIEPNMLGVFSTIVPCTIHLNLPSTIALL